MQKAYQTVQNICILQIKELLEKDLNRVFVVDLNGGTIVELNLSNREEIIARMQIICLMEKMMNELCGIPFTEPRYAIGVDPAAPDWDKRILQLTPVAVYKHRPYVEPFDFDRALKISEFF